ncbi:MAG: serine/threonine protein kinase [Myxococcales bacterium]|nr:serine/threonine protein kinase [Myxococcales bacterium]
MRQPVPFGKYLLLDRISVGGMAEVFKAKSYGVEGFEKIIAIKRILPTMGEDRDFIKMFIDEAKIAGQLAHANICQIFELGRIDGSHFIAMEYIWGKDLLQIQNRLRKLKQPMPIAMACFSIAKVLEGLDYAHRKRDPLGRPLEIVHRDCSPQNVLVSYEGEVKVIDFGIAKATSRNSRTMAGVLKGKFGYMSPEQVRGLPLDRRSDIFALGTMLYECLTGDRLFQGETDFSTLEKVRNVDIRPPREINPNIPEAIERVILKALAKDVEDRYQWCSEMLTDIQQFLMSQDVVFTAKTLSGWLKECFAADLDRERQLLETYKRVGRDGLIGGLPAAESKANVVDNLGEAGAPEGDATQLGGPSFDELEQQMAAIAEMHASAGGAVAAPQVAEQQEDENLPDDGDFGEEAPTEIFGDLDSPASPPASSRPAAGRPPTQAPPLKQPPKPPPGGRPNTGQPTNPPQYSQPMAATPSGPARSPLMPMGGPIPQPQDSFVPAQSSPPAGMMAQGYPQQQQPFQSGYGSQPPPLQQGPMSGPMPSQVPHGTPGAMAIGNQSHPMNALAPPGGQPAQKTVLGVQAPPGLGNYGGGYRPSAPQPLQAYPGYQQGYPGYPQQQGYPSPGPMPGYGQPQGALDPAATPEGKKKSTLGRDIGIGVGIAALVLVGFLIVKMFVLDSDTAAPPSTTPSTMGTLNLQLPQGVSVELFIDDKRVGMFRDKAGIPVNSGLRRVKLVGPNGVHCDAAVKLDPGESKTLPCVLPAVGTEAGSGSAAVASGSGTNPVETKADPKTDTKVDPKIDAKPDTKVDPKLDTKAPDPKATVKSPEVKAAEVKAPEVKAPDPKATPKTTDVKTDAKGSDQKAKLGVDTKTVDLKASDPKVDPKAVVKAKDPKAKDPKQKVADKAADPKAADPKATDIKADATKGYLQVFSKPIAKILVDGADSGMTTPITGRALSLTPGKHKITFVIGDDRFTYPIMVKAGATETMSKDLQ